MLLGTLGGCSLTSLTELTRGGEPVDDAGTMAEDAAVDAAEPGDTGSVDEDAGADASTNDAETDADASLDAGDDCPATSFCDDFEHDDLIGPWDRSYLIAGGTLAVGTEHARSGTRSLRVTTSDKSNSGAMIEKTLGSAKRYRLSYFHYIDKIIRHSNVTALSFRYETADRIVYLLFNDQNVKVMEEEQPKSGSFFYEEKGQARAMIVGRWVPVVFEVNLDVTPQHLMATYDGKLLYDGALAKTFGPTAPDVTAGVTYSEAGEPYTIEIDDLRVDLLP